MPLPTIRPGESGARWCVLGNRNLTMISGKIKSTGLALTALGLSLMVTPKALAALGKSGAVLGVSTQLAQALPQTGTSFLPSGSEAGSTILSPLFQVNIPAVFADAVTLASLVVEEESVFNGQTRFVDEVILENGAQLLGNLDANGIDIDVGTGEITASNLVYSVIAGGGIEVSGDQDLTITNADRGSAQKIFGKIKVGSDTAEAGSNTDTFEFSAGSGVALSLNTSDKKLTVSADNLSGWYKASSSNVALITSTNRVGIGTSSPTNKLEVDSGTDGETGITFTRVTSSSAAGVGGGKVLSVDSGGKLILVEDQTGGGGGATPSAEAVLPSATNGMTLYFNGTNWVSSNNLYHDGGSVGISTTSPVSRFHVFTNLATKIGQIIQGYTGQTANLTEWRDASGSVLSYVDANGVFNGSANVAGSLNPGLTNGSVLFQGASGITQDNGNFFWDDTTNRLGIGTTTPGSLLQLNGSSPFLTFVNTTSSNKTWIVGLSGTSFNIAESGGATTLQLRAGAPTNSIWADSTGVAIGTSGGANKLSVYGNVAIGTTYVGTASPTNGLIIQGDTGIGTTAPAQKLEVVGRAFINNSAAGASSTAIQFLAGDTGGVANYGIGMGATSTFGMIEYRSGTANTSPYGHRFIINGTNVMEMEGTGNIGLGTTEPANRLDVSGALAIGSYAGINTAPSNGMILSGNVGIGTSSPFAGTKLHINGSENQIGLRITNSASSGNVNGTVTYVTANGTANAYGDYTEVSGTVSNILYGSAIAVSGTATNGIRALSLSGPTAAANNYAIYSSGAAQSYLAGSLGIGTTTASSKLDIGDGSTADQGLEINGGTYATMRLQRAGTNKWGILMNNSAGSDDLSFYSYAGSTPGTKLYLDKDGYVGIGTTAPILPLHVIGTNAAESGTATPNGGLVVGSSGVVGLMMGVADSSAHGWIQARNKSTAIFYNLHLQPSGGNVGIGKAPTVKLDVAGNVLVGANGYVGLGESTGGGFANLISNNSGASAFTNNLNLSGSSLIISKSHASLAGAAIVIPGNAETMQGYIQFWTTPTGAVTAGNAYTPSSPRMVVDTAGLVGIGTTAPTARLHIVGGYGANDALTINQTLGGNILTASSSGTTRLALTNGGSLQIYGQQALRLADSDSSNYMALRSAATLDGDYTLTLPVNDGDSGQILSTDGNGALSWVTPLSLTTIGGVPTASISGSVAGYATALDGDGTIATTLNRTLFLNPVGGNVGIGTTAATGKLTVRHDFTGNISNLGAGAYGSLHITPANNTNGNIMGISFGAPDNGGSRTDAQAGIYVVGSGDFNGSTAGTRMYFMTTNNGWGGPKMRMMINELGYIGIGTSNPTDHVQIGDAGDSHVKLNASQMEFRWSSYSRLMMVQNIGFYGGLNYTSGGIRIQGENGGEYGYIAGGRTSWGASGYDLALNPGTTGSVGVGTPAPNSRLQVVGFGTTTGGALNITDVNGVSGLYVQDRGNVGMGTTSPVHRLQLTGTQTGKALVSLNETGTNDILTASSSGTTRFLLKESGRVGINTSNPEGYFHIRRSDSGRGYSLDGNDTLVLEQAGTNRIKWVGGNTDHQLLSFSDSDSEDMGVIAYHHDTDSMGFATNTVTALRIDSAQNVGLLPTLAFGTNASRVFAIASSTAPTTSITDGIQLFAVDVAGSHELQVRDEAGNVTTLSPHNFSLLDNQRSEDLAWAFYSERNGLAINADMTKALRVVEKLSGEKLVRIKNLTNGEDLTDFYADQSTQELALDNAEWITRAELNPFMTWGSDVLTIIGKTIFEKPTEFLADVTVRGRLYLSDKDAAGYAVIKAGATTVTVPFEHSFITPPVVTVTAQKAVSGLRVTQTTKDSFAIQIAEPLTEDVTINWVAVAVTDPRVVESVAGSSIELETSVTSPTPNPSASLAPTNSPTPSPTIDPTPTPTPSPEVSPVPTPTPSTTESIPLEP